MKKNDKDCILTMYDFKSAQEKSMDVNQLAVNTIRVLSAEAIEKAKSGHPGLPLGSAPIAYTLFSKHLKFNPKNPDFSDRDRFISKLSFLPHEPEHVKQFGTNFFFAFSIL